MKSIYEQAVREATIAHTGQVRKGSGEHFIVHPLGVSKIVEEIAPYYNFTNINFLKVVSVLHDTLEDTDFTEERMIELFGTNVTNTVKILSNRKKKQYELFIDDIINSGNRNAMIIKVADISHNLPTAEGVISDKKIQKWKNAKEKLIEALT